MTQDFLHAKGKKGFRFSDNPDHYESLVTVYKEKPNAENITDTKCFTILGSLVDGDAEDIYKRYLFIQNKTVALEHVWRGLELAYGYRKKKPMTEIYERSGHPTILQFRVVPWD